MNRDRQSVHRDLSNWLAIAINILQEQYRRPNHPELLKQLTTLYVQIPQVKQAIIYLMNTRGDQ